MMFHSEPEGRYCHRLCTAIAPFLFSTEHPCKSLMPFWLSTDDNVPQILERSYSIAFHPCLNYRSIHFLFQNLSYYTGGDSLSGHYNAKLRPAYSPTGYSTMDSRNSTLNRDMTAPLGPGEIIEEGITAQTQVFVHSFILSYDHWNGVMTLTGKGGGDV